jgi:hypothetical protein
MLEAEVLSAFVIGGRLWASEVLIFLQLLYVNVAASVSGDRRLTVCLFRSHASDLLLAGSGSRLNVVCKCDKAGLDRSDYIIQLFDTFVHVHEVRLYL